MFGLLRPSGSCGGACQTREAYARLYCGLCAGIGDAHGLLWRGTLSYDGVFVALFVEALQEAPAPPSRTRCPILPLVHRPTIAHDAVAIRYASAVQALLTHELVEDRAAEGRPLFRLARHVVRPSQQRALASLLTLGVDLTPLADFGRTQAACEAADGGPSQAAAPTATALGTVFAAIAELPGVVGERGALRAFGQALGRAIYLIDAFEDRKRDQARGDYNPCLSRGRVSHRRIQEARTLLRDSLDELTVATRTLPFQRHQSIVHDIVVHSLARRAEAALSLPSAAPRPFERIGRALAAVALFLWAWLCAIPRAFARHDSGAPQDVDAALLLDAGPAPSAVTPPPPPPPPPPPIAPPAQSAAPASPPPAGPTPAVPSAPAGSPLCADCCGTCLSPLKSCLPGCPCSSCSTCCDCTRFCRGSH